MPPLTRRPLRAVGAVLLAFVMAGAAAAEPAYTLRDAISVRSVHGFDALIARLEAAIDRHKMGLVAQASASRGAAARGIKIPGNAVLMVFRNDYAVRMLDASIAAGIEAPLRIYVTEERDGTATVTYRAPSAVFAPYGNRVLDEMAKELDVVFHNIVHDAAGRGG